MSTGPKILTIFVIIIAVCLLCVGSGYIGYNHSLNMARVNSQYTDNPSAQNNSEIVEYDIGYQAGYQAGLKEATSGYNLHDPTYQEVMDFLETDDSNDTPYSKNDHICTDYTTEVNNNAEKLGLRCASVYIIYPDTGHSIVGFDTTDQGMIFIEPQFDKEVTLPVGKSYSTSNGFLQPDDIDDTIVRYLIMW
jgi:hypothetical protein